MGVNTLLKQLAPCLEDSHVERFRGKTVAVDGNTFIFRGCYSCSEQVRGRHANHVLRRFKFVWGYQRGFLLFRYTHSCFSSTHTQQSWPCLLVNSDCQHASTWTTVFCLRPSHAPLDACTTSGIR